MSFISSSPTLSSLFCTRCRMFGDCALFEFSMSVRFEPEDSKLFLCDGPSLPPSLNGVNYINQKTGYLHIADTYWVDFVGYSFFEIKQPTYFKLSAQPPADAQNFAVSLFSEENSSYWVIESTTIYRLLTPGNYSFFVTAFAFDDDNVCPEGIYHTFSLYGLESDGKF